MAAPERPRAKRAGKLPCGCLIGDEGPIILCRTASRLARRVNDLIPPYGDDDPADWDVFHETLARYREHVGPGVS